MVNAIKLRIILQFLESGESFSTEIETSGHQFDVTFVQRIVHHPFILLDQDRTGGIDNVSTNFGAIDGSQDEFLLEMGTPIDIFVVFRCFGRGIFRYDASTTARGV